MGIFEAEQCGLRIVINDGANDGFDLLPRKDAIFAASDALEPIAGGGPPGDCRVCRFGQPDGPVRDEVAMSA